MRRARWYLVVLRELHPMLPELVEVRHELLQELVSPGDAGREHKLVHLITRIFDSLL